MSDPSAEAHASETASAAAALPPVMPAERARVMRGARIAAVVVLVLLAVGAGRTVWSRIANSRVLEANAGRSVGPVREDDVRQGRADRADARLARHAAGLPCSRRSRPAPAAT